jgi:hypothetical protein
MKINVLVTNDPKFMPIWGRTAPDKILRTLKWVAIW